VVIAGESWSSPGRVGDLPAVIMRTWFCPSG
jgi:hypothetical protein